MFPTRFESLSNEVLIEVFDYLDGYTLCSTFFGLNRRLNGLFRIAPIHIEFNNEKTNSQAWDTLDSIIQPAQIRSLLFDDVKSIDGRFVNSNAINLGSVIVKRVDHLLLKTLLDKLPMTLPLKNLAVTDVRVINRTPGESPFEIVLQKNGHRLSAMINAALSFAQFPENVIALPVKFSRLRRLALSIRSLSISSFGVLQRSMPNLRSLKIRTQILRPDRSLASNGRFRHVVELDLSDMDSVISLSQILTLFPSLKKLHVEWRRIRRSPVLGGSDWQKIVEPCVLHLRQFTLRFIDNGLDEATLQTFYQNEFWTARKIQARMTIDKARNLCPQVTTIYFGRQWHFSHFDQTALDISPKDGINPF